MDKKILLSGAAALIMGAGLFAAPASANITFSHSGEANLSALMGDWCNVNTAALADNADFATAVTQGTADDGCGTANEEAPLWTTDSDLEWSAGGTLANGLGVSISDAAAITLSGAFGSVTFEDGGDSAATKARVNSDADIDIIGDTVGAHNTATAGTAGMVVTYAAPSMGGMDLFVSYAPNSNGGNGDTAIDTDNGDYTDTIGFGASFSLDNITIGAGFENATFNGPSTCYEVGDVFVAATGAGDPTANTALLAQAAEVAGGDVCGDQNIISLGATMAAGDLSLNAGYSKLDSEEADKTVMNLGLGMAVGAYNLTLDYVDAKLAYVEDVADTAQTVIAVGASTNLGDGVDLGLSFSNNQINIVGTGAHTNYRAEAKLTVTY